MKKIKKYLTEHIQFYFMKKAYLLGVIFFPGIKWLDTRLDVRFGFGFFAIGILFGKKSK